MKIEIGNLWNSTDDIILVTTNATVKKNGEVVMGRGAAKEAKEKFPLFPKIIGDQISTHYSSGGEYGLLILHPYTVLEEERVYGKYLGAFQVKYNWWEDANLNLIRYSTNLLYSAMNNQFKDMTCSMNFPGIGNGRVSYKDVLKVVSRLPDNVSLYMRG